MKGGTSGVLGSFMFRLCQLGFCLLDRVFTVHPNSMLSPRIIREFYGLHPDDHTRIIGINQKGQEVALQGFNQSRLLPGVIDRCLATHRIGHPDLLIVVVDLKTGEDLNDLLNQYPEESVLQIGKHQSFPLS